jgi:hypothetical protein
MSRLLKLHPEKLSALADLQRKDELKRTFSDPPTPLFKEVRELILRKCSPARETQIRSIFEKQPFGELERLVTQKLLGVVKRVAREELDSRRLHLVAGSATAATRTCASRPGYWTRTSSTCRSGFASPSSIR